MPNLVPSKYFASFFFSSFALLRCCTNYNGIYPILFLDYLLQVIGNNDIEGNGSDDSFGSASGPAQIVSPAFRFMLLTSTTIILTYVNWRGLALVGKMSILICVIAMSPFVILIVVGSFKIDPSRWWTLPNTAAAVADIEATDDNGDDAGGILQNFALGGVLWRPFLNNLFWNLNSFDNTGCLVAELDSSASFIQSTMLVLPWLLRVTFSRCWWPLEARNRSQPIGPMAT
mmetsp:Transcript_96080/g.195330  ORF Transcript_96080/g.195330 Transcript_96080/m.195330 type:complete len:230 (+) Transcript_96080:32-721(+)